MLIGKNKLKMCKEALVLFFAFLFSIESMAAVVSDNDGSAFITKAEFDSLKNDFQSQLDAYNTSIDSKIDNAIASYLKGINIAAETTLKNSYKDMTIVGNKDSGVLWSSNNNKTFCTDNTQKLAMDYYYITGIAYNGVGYAGYWHKVVDTEANGRQRKRFWVDKDGFVKGRNIWKFWVYGGWTGAVWKNFDSNSIMGHQWSSHLALNKINKRTDAVYTGLRGNAEQAINYHYGSAVYLYHEEQTATNENIGVYPLSETTGEYVADDRKQTISVTGSSQVWLNDTEFGFTNSNMSQLGTYNKADCGSQGCSDSISVTLSGPFTSYKLSDFKYLDFYNKNSKNAEIKCGIAIATATDDSEITVKGECSHNGYIILYSSNVADKLWKGKRTSVTDTSSWKTTNNSVTANVEWSKTIKGVKKGEGIFILYLPSDTSVLGSMNITEIKQKREQ